MSVIKENPGLTGSEIAAKLGKSKEYVVPRLWILKRYTQSVRIEKSGFVRTPGLDEFRKVPSVQRMLGKLGSEKTKGPWTRRLFRYEQWLKQRGYFNSITEALEAYKKADTEDKKYFHVNLIQEFLNSWKADKDTKDSIVTVLRGFYRKNRAELPREKIVYSKDMLLNTPSGSEDYVKPEEIWRIINDGRVPVRDKAIISVLLYMGLDESTLATQFNYYAYPQLVKALGESFADWEVSRAPIRINLIRPKTSTKYYNFLPQKGLQFLKDWLNVRKQIMGSDIKIRREAGGDVSDPIFISSKRRPIYEALVASVVRDSSFKAGVQRQTLGTKRYRIHGHEFRDTFKTTCKFAGMDGAVAEFFIGHSIDKLGYDKSPWAYPDHFREQYSLVEPYLSGEGRQYRVQEEKRRELEDRIKSLESALSRLVAEKGEQVLAMDRTRR
ncbi:MAG: tyrosine-type recombinase/integrase [Thaumarchaeota archaeon]|nr:tyrosine-type recombinase/integrase [Nitrososphaerota archaeon]